MIIEERSDEVGTKKSHIVTFRLHPKSASFCTTQLADAALQQPPLVAKTVRPVRWVKATTK